MKVHSNVQHERNNTTPHTYQQYIQDLISFKRSLGALLFLFQKMYFQRRRRLRYIVIKKRLPVIVNTTATHQNA